MRSRSAVAVALGGVALGRAALGGVALGLAALGCGGSPGTAELPTYDPADETKAGVTKSSLRPLVIEWPAADRASLEARKADGLVAVRYVGGTIEVLPSCTSAAAYAYRPLTPKRERIVIRDARELGAALPIHTAALRGKIQEKKTLVVDLTIVGTYQAAASQFRVADLRGECASATHVVRAVVVGAFEISAAASSSAEGGVRALGAELGGAQSSERELLDEDGDDAACAEAGGADASPPYRCGALLRLELAPVVHPSACPEGAPEPCRVACGPGQVARDGGCVASAPSRPALLDVLGK